MRKCARCKHLARRGGKWCGPHYRTELKKRDPMKVMYEQMYEKASLDFFSGYRCTISMVKNKSTPGDSYSIPVPLVKHS